MRILWVVIDALGSGAVTPELMPNLWRLSSGLGPGLLSGVLPSSTYPNHATFVTGAVPAVHGIYANQIFAGGRWSGAGSVGPGVPTIFDHLGADMRGTAAVFGDPELVGVCGADAAGSHWPPGGALPAAIDLGPLGCSADSATVAAARSLRISEAAFAMVQLDENDAVNHLEGPASDAARSQAGRSDAALGELLELYGAHWDDTAVMVMSDHCCEAVGAVPGVGMDALLGAVLAEVDPDAHWYCDGTSAVIAPGHRPDVEAVVAGLDCVAGVAGGPGEGLCVWGADGVLFGLDWGQRGDHGSIRCRDQVGVIGGGHPVVPEVQVSMSGSLRGSTDWFALAVELLEGSQ